MVLQVTSAAVCFGYVEIFKESSRERKKKWWPLQTDLPHLHMPCPEIHGPWWFRLSSNHRQKNPPTDSALSLTSPCYCQPWQELEGTKLSKLSKVTGNEQTETQRENTARQRGERRKKRRRVTTVRLKGKRHNLAWLQTQILLKSDYSTGEKATYLWFVITLVKRGTVDINVSHLYVLRRQKIPR